MKKDDYIYILSKNTDRYGSLLLQMMDRYNVSNLQQLSENQVKEFYEEWKNDRCRVSEVSNEDE